MKVQRSPSFQKRFANELFMVAEKLQKIVVAIQGYQHDRGLYKEVSI